MLCLHYMANQLTKATNFNPNDKTCIECPALGYCWGGCVSGHVFIGNKPSLHCSRKELVPHIKNLADNNELLSRSSKQYLKSLI